MVVAAEETAFRLRTLQQSASVTLAYFDHPSTALLHDTEEQADSRHQINFVERGCFRLHHGRRNWTLGAGAIFLSKPGDAYLYGHIRDAEPDACLSLAFSTSVASEVTSMFDGLPLVVHNTNRLNFLRLQLFDRTPLALDTTACEILDAARCVDGDDGRRLYAPRQLHWYARRIGDARDAIDADPTGEHSIWRLASAAAMSPFRFAHVFRELVGSAPHIYVVRKRLELARTLLREGMSVTETCFAAGYNNAGHFTRSFKRHFGVLPSDVRRV